MRIPISLNMAASDTEEFLHCCWLVTWVCIYISVYLNRENIHDSACKARAETTTKSQVENLPKFLFEKWTISRK